MPDAIDNSEDILQEDQDEREFGDTDEVDDD